MKDDAISRQAAIDAYGDCGHWSIEVIDDTEDLVSELWLNGETENEPDNKAN